MKQVDMKNNSLEKMLLIRPVVNDDWGLSQFGIFHLEVSIC